MQDHKDISQAIVNSMYSEFTKLELEEREKLAEILKKLINDLMDRGNLVDELISSISFYTDSYTTED